MLDPHRQKAYELKLTQALADAYRKVLANGNQRSEDEIYNDLSSAIEALRKAFGKGDLSEQKKQSTQAIAMLLNYQIKFL